MGKRASNPQPPRATQLAEQLQDVALVIIQCGQYEVIGQPLRRPRWWRRSWKIGHAMGFRRIGEGVKMETMPGRTVTVCMATFPAMVTELPPGSEGHAQLLKAYGSIAQEERVKRAGIEIVKPGRKGAQV